MIWNEKRRMPGCQKVEMFRPQVLSGEIGGKASQEDLDGGW